MDYFVAMKAFLRSVELGSFSKAAVEAGVKVSTISRYIAELEADLGAALFNRSTRRLHLTEAGRLFYERTAQILGEVEDARMATRSWNGRPQGLLRINIPTSFGRRHVMPHMKEFFATYPDITLDATLTDVTVDLIESGADVGVRIGALVDSAFIAKHLAPQRRLLVAAPSYLEGRSHVTRPDDLAHHQCLILALQPIKSWYYRSGDTQSAKPVEVAVEGRLRVNDSETLRDAAVDGLGIALLPSWLVGNDLRAGRLASILPQLEWLIAPGPERAIWAIYPPKKIVSAKVKAFIAFLIEKFGSPPYWDQP